MIQYNSASFFRYCSYVVCFLCVGDHLVGVRVKKWFLNFMYQFYLVMCTFLIFKWFIDLYYLIFKNSVMCTKVENPVTMCFFTWINIIWINYYQLFPIFSPSHESKFLLWPTLNIFWPLRIVSYHIISCFLLYYFHYVPFYIPNFLNTVQLHLEFFFNK